MREESQEIAASAGDGAAGAGWRERSDSELSGAGGGPDGGAQPAAGKRAAPVPDGIADKVMRVWN
jgi:hypothetical protein